jgi:hypothetical protein
MRPLRLLEGPGVRKIAARFGVNPGIYRTPAVLKSAFAIPARTRMTGTAPLADCLLLRIMRLQLPAGAP